MVANKTVSVGVVGTSWWVDTMYLPALQAHPNARVVAICGRNAENAQKMADRWQIPQVYTDYNAMINKENLDAIIVSTINDAHYPITLAALNAELHVLCEKPLSLTYSQAQEMADLAEKKGVIHMVPFTYSFMPTARYLKELIDDGYIGKPYHLNLRYYADYGREAGDYRWRYDVSKAGTGVLGDLGTHFLYLARWYYGEITSVCVQLGHMVPRAEVDMEGNPYEVTDDAATIMLTFENGAQGVIQVSCLCHEGTAFGQTHHMDFHGSDGTLYSFTDWDTVQRVSGARTMEGVPKELPIPDHIWGQARRDTVHNTYRDVFRKHDFMTRNFITGIVEGKPVSPDFHDGARIQRIVEAMIRSHHERRWVDVHNILPV